MASRRAEAIVPFLTPPPAQPQNWQAGAIFETPSIWLTLFDPTWRTLETPPQPNFGSTHAAFPYEWLVLAHAAQLPESSQTSNSWLQEAPGLTLAAASLDSQLGFTWESLSPAQVVVTSDCLIA